MMTILNTRHYMMEMIDQYKKKQIVQPIDYETGIYCFSTKRAAFRSKRKDCLARNQANVSNMSLP
jgi:hypothetical protein